MINANNSVLMSASEDGWIFFWDITPITVAAQPAFPRFRCVGCCCLHKGFVCQLKYDAVNDLLFSAGDDGLVCAWNVALVDPMKPHARQNLGEEELLVFALQHGGSFRFGGNSGTSPANSVLFCDLSPDGRFIATGAKDGTVRIWRIPFIVRNDMQVTRRVRRPLPPSRLVDSPRVSVSAPANAVRSLQGSRHGVVLTLGRSADHSIGGGGQRVCVELFGELRGVHADCAAL